MGILSSTLNARDPETLANHEALRVLVDDLRERLAAVAAGGGAEPMRRHVERGKLPPRERIEAQTGDLGIVWL
ncbi:MAG: hypothetical protein ACO22W_04960, partial [Steroidobacteraceae bacterium]